MTAPNSPPAAPSPARNLPRADRLLEAAEQAGLATRLGHAATMELIRADLDRIRAEVLAGAPCPPPPAIEAALLGRLAEAARGTLRPVVNATGVVVHTNLGRAPLSEDALDAMRHAAEGYASLEYDLDAGERGDRHRHVEAALCRLTGAEGAVAVNNNAAAVMLALAAVIEGAPSPSPRPSPPADAGGEGAIAGHSPRPSRPADAGEGAIAGHSPRPSRPADAGEGAIVGHSPPADAEGGALGGRDLPLPYGERAGERGRSRADVIVSPPPSPPADAGGGALGGRDHPLPYGERAGERGGSPPEVIVSRGQLVEIGGGFRIPDVLRRSGAALVEVGTTNRTYLADYAEAIGPRTRALLTVHRSNFRLSGFTHDATLEELVGLARERGIRVVDDLGSGTLLETAPFGLGDEPTVQRRVRAGADLVCFSGDKLLGGPQAGLLVGRRDAIARVKRHPLVRALRVDKVTLAGLSATLAHYERGEAPAKVPVWRAIALAPEALRERARAWLAALGDDGRGCEVREARSAVGGGSLPEVTLPTAVLALPPGDADALARRLRRGDPPVVARIEADRVVLDPRTVLPREDGAVVRAVRAALRG